MNKRVISLVLVVMMLMTLVPFSAFAIGGTTITKQPTDAYVNVGGTATFTISASNSNSSNLKYVWVDADRVDTENISDFSNFLKSIGGAKLGEGNTLSLTKVTEDMDGMTIACVVYYINLLIPRDLIVSAKVTLHVNAPACESHSLDTNLVKVDAKEATCAEQGNIEYYYCTVCNRCYIDAEGKVNVSADICTLAKLYTHGNISYVETAEGTCCEKGHSAYYQCDVCGKMFSDAEGTAVITDKDVSTDKVADNHTNLVEYPAVAATCSKQGNIRYWYCDGCKDYFSDAEGKTKISKAKLDVDKDPANHTALQEFSAVAATCKAPGNIHYWYCGDCKDYFSDAQGKTKISRSDTVLPQLAHKNQWCAVNENGVEWHEYRCTICGTVDKTGAHSGGEAGCCDKAVCTVCVFEYGSVDPDNHKNQKREITKEATPTENGLCNIYCLDCGKLIAQNAEFSYKESCKHSLVLVEEVHAKCEAYKDGDPYGIKEHYVCEICGAMFSDNNGNNEITDPDTLKIEPLKHYLTVGDRSVSNMVVQQYAYDVTGHWRECKYCHYTYVDTFSNHTINSATGATCCNGNYCIVCKWDDGQRDPDNHTGPFDEKVGAYEPAGNNPGYTGDKVCRGCEAVVEIGRYYYAKCGDCAKNLKHFDAVPSTCTEDGTKEYWMCTKCGNIYMDAKASVDGDSASIVDKCTGHDLHPGTDILKNVDVVSLAQSMGWTYIDLLKLVQSGNLGDIKNLSIDKFLDNITIKDIDHCSDDTNHWLGCQRCGMSLADLRSDLEKNGIFISEKWYELSAKQAHSGGLATCNSKAVCSVCGDEYGAYGNHRYDKVVTAATCTEAGNVKYICNDCNAEDTERAEYHPALGHKFEKGVCTRSGCNARITNPFWDVSNKDIYYTAVMWAYTYEPQITAGKRDNYFCPNDPCTRGQVVTFLWRAAGCPEPESDVNPFTDVYNSGACKPFYKAILWASEQGITTGVTKTTFVPDRTVSRAEFVTFLWRYYGKPMPATNRNPFVDVNNSSVFRDAILWAYGQGITTGYDDTHFRPNTPCKRWQVVMFLYRAIGEGKAY